mmetsp:Transcript_34094/g.79725  ORF Transcript_34094/g.79725 Transcript_34094/m.79725 type:complete len:693 (+) Transcript_34094:129-2207(+)
MKILAACLALLVSFTAASPVERVVHLLADLKKSVKADEAKEQQIYNQFACWCENAAKAKATAIENAEAQLQTLAVVILKLKGEVATLSSEIKQLTKELAENAEAQAGATSLRQKENEAFQAESAETKQALAALEKAITILVKGSTPSLLQQSFAPSSQAAVLAAYAPKLDAAEHAVLLQAFAMAKGKYAPQSITIQGMLTDMYDTFSKSLEAATKLESGRNKAFEDLMASLKDAETEMTEAKAAKEKAKSEAEANLAAATQSYDDTQKQKEADIAFFELTSRNCKAKKEEWDVRQSLRSQELAGIDKAISILSDDDARELFANAIKPGMEVGADSSINPGTAPALLQAASVSSESAQAKAFKSLKVQATKLHSLRLAQLAVSVRTAKGANFHKVLAAIDAMVQTLKDEGASDVAKKDQCTSEYAKTASDIDELKWRIEKSTAQSNKLDKALGANEKEQDAVALQITTLDEEVNNMKVERAEEHAAFQQAKKDDQAAVDLLQQARAALANYYEENGIPLSLVDKSGAPAPAPAMSAEFVPPPPDATFSDKASHGLQSKGIVGIMAMLIEDLNNEIRNGITDEAMAQSTFMEELAKAADLKRSLVQKKDNLEEAEASLKEELVQEEERQETAKAELKDEVDYKASITPDCDWILGAFEERASKRAAEAEALGQAKAYLSGASTESSPSFLQRRR